MATLSAFLPTDFNPQQTVAVVAGKGDYPILTVGKLRAAGIPVRLIAFEDETDLRLVESFPQAERTMIKVGQLGHMLKAIKKFGACYMIMAGQITPRRLFRGMTPDLKAIAILATLKERNAESIFGAIAREVEAIGVRQLDARALLDDHLADEGLMSKGRYLPEAQDVDFGVRMAKEIARLDIGQGVVIKRGTVLAVEAFEGTDPMLRRAGTFDARAPLFVKTVKPRQDYRFDVPVFGLRTLDVMAEAGLGAAALEARNTILLNKPEVLAQARKLGITLLGYSAQ